MRLLYRLWIASLCAAVLPTAALPSAALAQTPAGKTPTTLSRGIFGEPDTLVPRESGVASAQTMIRDLFEGLTTFDAAGATIPGAALSWTASADGLVYTFRLRPNLRWSDGTTLRADDFVWGWQHSLDARRPAARATRLYALRNAERIHRGEAPVSALGARALDARTLQLTLEHPVPWLPTLLAGEEGFPLPRHVIERVGRDWAKPGIHVGNGAYRLLSRRARGSVLLERNPHHHDAPRIAIDRIEYVPSNDTPSLVMRVRAGELAINGWPGYPGAQTQALTQELGAAIVRSVPLHSVRYLRLNVARGPLRDARVRRALALAVDRDLLVRRVLASGERPSTRVLPAGLPLDLPPESDPLRRGTQAARNAEARALLAAAGYPRAGSAPLVFRVPSGNGEQMCVAVAAMWTALGIPVRIERSEISAMISDLRQGNFDIALTGAQEPPAVEPFLERFRAASTYNSGRYSSREFETTLDLALQQADPQQRARGLQKAEALLNRDQPVVPLIEEVARNLVRPNVTGWQDNPLDVHLSRWLRLGMTAQ
jgi:oligopeptide transport system substrate-binding protein